MKRKTLALAVVLVLGTAALPVLAQTTLPPGGTFSDDDGSVHEGFIEAIAEAGITFGCNPPDNDLYCPDDPVTRGQMAAFLVRALDLPAGTDAGFTDVEAGSTFEDDINRLAAMDITRGCNPPDNTQFCPDDPVTRGQMAAFLVRGLGYSDAGAGDLFTDDDGSTFEDDIDRLATAGVTRGCNPPDSDQYCPTDLVTREQMASFLGRALALTPNVPPSTTSTTVDDGSTSTTVDDSSTTTVEQTTSTSEDEVENVVIEATNDNVFVPDTVSIDTGDSVTINNVGGSHDLVWDDGAPGVPNVSSGWSSTRTFDTSGSYGFVCTIHAGMEGTVEVSG